MLEKLDEIRLTSENSNNKTNDKALKKELGKIESAKPSFAYKLENSSEVVAGMPSANLVAERNFVSSYIDYQLKQPETRLRHTSDRYRQYAKQLESANNRKEVIKASSEIRLRNARIGLWWKNLEKA